MASEDIVEKIQDSFLSCTICFQPFNRPKALPCLHTFCEGCLRDYVASRYEGVGRFPCPVCRREIPLPPGGASGFPNNHFITGLSDAVGPFSVNDTETAPLLPGTKLDHFAIEANTAKLLTRFGNFGTAPHQFQHIAGLALSEFSDDVIVSDCVLNKIGIFSVTGEFRGAFRCDCSIRDLAVTRAGTILVAVSKSGSAILREYSTDGRLLGTYGSFYKYEDPSGLALNGFDQPIISALRENCVHILTQQKKRSVKFGSRGKGPNHFSFPYHLAADSKDRIIVSDSGNHRIKVHRADGSFLRQFGKEGTRDGELFYPMGVCVDQHDHIYVADATNYRVQMFNPEGEYVCSPVTKTYEYGMDVKPINVLCVHRNILLVVLKGSRFSEIHAYHWDADQHKPKPKEDQGFCFYWCCRGQGYDDL